MKETLKQSGQNVFSAAGLAGLSEAMFLFVFAAYQILLTLGSTMFSLSLPIDINQILINALLVTGILKLIFQLAVAEKESRKTQLKIIFAALPTALMWMLVWRNGGGQFSCFLALLTVACIGTDYRKILRWSMDRMEGRPGSVFPVAWYAVAGPCKNHHRFPYWSDLQCVVSTVGSHFHGT